MSFASISNLQCGTLIFLIALLAGCTPAKTDSIQNAVTVRGTVLNKAGQPLAVAGRDIGTGMVSVTFIPVNAPAGSDQTFAASADAAGKFNVPDGMPAGEYRVAVRQWEPYPTTDKLGGRYDETNTPLKVTITGKDDVKLEVEEK